MNFADGHAVASIAEIIAAAMRGPAQIVFARMLAGACDDLQEVLDKSHGMLRDHVPPNVTTPGFVVGTLAPVPVSSRD